MLIKQKETIISLLLPIFLTNQRDMIILKLLIVGANSDDNIAAPLECPRDLNSTIPKKNSVAAPLNS